MTTTERLALQLAQCHKALLLAAADFDELARRGGCTESQQDEWLKVAENLRRFVKRQQEGKV